MKRFKYIDTDREKKFHKVIKSNKVDKHKKMLYDFDDNELDDLKTELEFSEENSSTNTQ